MNISDRIEPILTEIETTLLLNSSTPMKYSDQAFRASVFIFTNALMNRMFEFQTEYEEMTAEEAEKMAEVAGEEVRKLIRTFTGVDTHDLWEKA